MGESPFLIALSSGLERLERVLLRVWQLLCLLGIVTGLVYAAVVSRPLGYACALGSSLFLIWFVIAGNLADRGEAPRSLSGINAAVEALVPWAFLLGIVWSNGPEYALGSWVPPFLFCSSIVTHVARLRLWAPAILGASGALAYPATYWFFVVDRLPPSALGFLLNQPSTQHARSVTLAASGLIGTLLVFGLHSVIVSAESAARERELGGRFRVVRDHSAGATGVLYEGEYCPEGGFSRKVAIRRFHSHVTEHAELLDGFRQAAFHAAQLVHPNIVQVHDFLRTKGAHYLVLEWVDGVSLDALTRTARATRQGLDPELVAYVGLELFAGLAHAHSGALGPDGHPLRVLHRDLSPDGILVSTAGEVKLGGFWVAAALRDFNRQSEGHHGYMAPECAAGTVDERSDLYSAGAIVWELLLGRRRTPGEATLSTEIRPDLTPEWDRFFARAIAHAPEARAESAMELMALLAAVPRRDASATRHDLATLVSHVRASHAARTGGYEALNVDGKVADRG
ncbi:MAG: serine/threonine protein kinase [Polyangiaceae bacterium]|nr:serine/threonine protein kinase [Polyangiaceae bacterium]